MAIHGDDTDISVLYDEDPSINIGLRLDQHQEEFQLFRGRRSCENDNNLESYHALNYAYNDLKHRYNDLLHKYTTVQHRRFSFSSSTSPRPSATSSRRGSMGDEFVNRGPRDLYSQWQTGVNLSPRNSSDGHLRRHSPLSHAVDMDAAGATDDDSPYLRPSRTGVGQMSTSSRPHSNAGGANEQDLLHYLAQHGMDVEQFRSLSLDQTTLRRENKSLQEKLSGHEQVNQHLSKMNRDMTQQKTELERKVKLLEDALRDQRPRSSSSGRDASPATRISPRPRASSTLDDDETMSKEELEQAVTLLMQSQDELRRLKEHIWKQNQVIRMLLGRYHSPHSGSVDSSWLNDAVRVAQGGEQPDSELSGSEGQGARPKVRSAGHLSEHGQIAVASDTAERRLTASTSTERLLKPHPKPRTKWSSDPALDQMPETRERSRSHLSDRYSHINEEIEQEDGTTAAHRSPLVSPSRREPIIRPRVASSTPSIENSLIAHGVTGHRGRSDDESTAHVYDYVNSSTLIGLGIHANSDQPRASEIGHGLQKRRQLDRQPDADREFDLDLPASPSRERGRGFDLDFRRAATDRDFDISSNSSPDISPEIERELEPIMRPDRDTYSDRLRQLDLESVGDMDIGQGQLQGQVITPDSNDISVSPDSFQPSTLVMEESSSPMMEERNNALVNQDDRMPMQPRPINIDRNEYESVEHRDNDNTRQNVNLSTTLTADKYRPSSGEYYTGLNNDILVTHKTIPRRNLYHDTSETPERSSSTPSSGENTQVIRICPVCNDEFPSSMHMDDFQEHVLECVMPPDDTPSITLGACSRVCPMCNEIFPSTVTQEVFENHVHEHFGEGPINAADPFEFVPSDTGV